jgi:hypothetical protein
MALQKSFSFVGTATLETADGKLLLGEQTSTINAYIKVVSISGGKDQLRVSVGFSEGAKEFVKNYSFTPSVANGSANFIAQAYEHLKTLPEFSGATDC